MSVMMIEQSGSCFFQQSDQCFFIVDSHMTLINVDVIVGQHPADPFGEITRYADHEWLPRFEYPDDFPHRLFVIGDVLQNFTADNHVEAFIRKGQRRDIGCGKAPGAATMLAQAVVKNQALPGQLQIFQAEVRAGDMHVLLPVGFGGVTTGTATDIKDAITWRSLQARQINGNH